MTKQILSASTVLALVIGLSDAALAQAPEPAAHPIIGNTLIISNRFAVSHASFLTDGTFRHTGPNGVAAVGRWEIKGDDLCSTQTDPPPPVQPWPTFCMPIAGRRLGDTWEAHDERNGLIRYRLIEGLVDAPIGFH